MLTFEEKIAILDSYPELERRDVSLGRVNYHYEESGHDKKIVAYHLHSNGNGFVFAGLLRGYETDAKGFVNIRDYTAGELRALVAASIQSLAAKAAKKTRKESKAAGITDELWVGPDLQQLTLGEEDDLWYTFSGANLDMAFESREEAEAYLLDEGFSPDKS